MEMETTYRIVDQPGQSSKRGGVFIKYKIIAFVTVVVLVVVISVVLLAAFLGAGRKNSGSEKCDNSSGKPPASGKSADQTTQLSCDVAIVGGGISGLYVAETLLRLHKETNVCLFERDDRFGGRIRDHTFQRMPGVPVSLGAWRVDESNSLVWELLKRFNISVSYLAKDYHDRLEARGIFATDRLTLKKKAFPSLNHGKFENATFEQMMGYLFTQRKEADKFASISDFLSEYLTPEGFQLFNYLYGLLLPNYERQFSARSLFDFGKAYAPFKENFTRPESGLSTITKALKVSATNLGANLYKNEEIKVIENIEGNKFKLITTNYTATSNKLVVAVPPKPMKHIKGSVAEKIKKDPAFQTIEFMVAFKGFAVFEEAWWQHNTTGSRYLANEQIMISASDCLGFLFPYKARGLKGEAVLQMSYTNSGCAVKWGKLLKISKESVDREMNRALQRLFPGVEIPKPLDTVYVYWAEGHVHFQRAGTRLSSFELSEWAKRPFTGQDLFIVGEAYQPLRGWIEGALQSAQNTLREGWGIENNADFMQRRELKEGEAIKDNFDWTLFP